MTVPITCYIMNKICTFDFLQMIYVHIVLSQHETCKVEKCKRNHDCQIVEIEYKMWFI